ncbi:methyltransferase type 11 [Lichtheimia corymbifera JMRC:FSU:9682]|uniref:Methyltransferase type 11 n=1 Tax=Lichtheimia corymbifera JMRC:FSU:9682 TaxID=1263082 RepID=A0A068RR10_9FUNG|nr:methyltransferase type 11 [Lichtheimia corymbifera JMRC:FSU:9682]
MSIGSEQNYRYENGRQYYNNKSVSYVLPSDEEESKRVSKQHLLLKAGFGGNYDAPVREALEKGIVVLDAGCGPAAWTTEMAKDYPNSTFYGVDIAPRCLTTPPANCHFHTKNLVEEKPFPDNHLDYIHQRLLVLGLLEANWDKVIAQHMQMLKPGGWIELVEVTFRVLKNGGPKATKLMHAMAKNGGDKGLNMEIPFQLEERLKKAGAVNVSMRMAPTPINHGGEIGDICWEDFYEAFYGMQALIAQVHPEMGDADYFKNYLLECKEECHEYKTSLQWYRCIGQKPLDVTQ